ncbi:major capsid protein [Synechococcus phage S-SZBM1]|uniref:Major capsid protein n=1 Tax=Synechococcus phage S-SZBM1 TaxID=2926475 RepID=A0AC61TSS5_9CAUD|nr:major head protein [Synechococcus phage S-SZBM1]UNH61293.1 major capsid protein [Synechococcus phage S-SZBM1]
MFNSEHLQEKWAPILEHSELDSISDKYRKAVTSILLENQEKFLAEERGILTEAAPTMSAGSSPAGFSGLATATGPVAGFDPVLISLIRRSMPKLIAYDIAGVQPMTGPTGLIFAMRSRYGTDRTSGAEAFFNEANSEFSSENAANSLDGTNTQTGSNPGLLNDGGTYTQGGAGMSTAQAEALGDGAGNQFAEMNFSIEKVTVTAKSRALKAEYSLELAQDLKAVHGLDAESELANILSTEVLAEINREVVRTVYRIARPGAQNNTANPGIFDLDVDSNGRWSVEKFKGLLFQIERDLNAIGHETRRGKGNILICSADVASALSMAGVLDYTPALAGNAQLNGDDNSSTLAGTLNGRVKVYVDPYSANVSDRHFYVAGYKGASAYDAGLFYCPYVPLQMVRAVGQDTFQPKIGFKTRYGMVANPFAEGTAQGEGALNANANRYYRRVLVDNLM